MDTTHTSSPIGRTSIDERLERLVGEHAVKHVDATAFETTELLAEPAGMTMDEERELAVLMQLADPGKDGDEEAAIERLVAALEPAKPASN